MFQLLRVLIIDDSEDDTLLLVRGLRKGGYEPLYKRVQAEADMRLALKEESWDLIISDHDMPSFSALAALAVLKENKTDLPFIVVSGAVGEETAVALMKAGAHDFIKKGKLSRLIPAIARELLESERRRKQHSAEAALRWREQEFKALAEHAPDIVARYDRKRRYLYVNPAMEKDTGLPRNIFIGRTHEELKMHQQALETWNSAFSQASLTGRESTFFFKYSSPQGLKCYHTRVVPEYGPDGKVSTFLSITRDVTELKNVDRK